MAKFDSLLFCEECATEENGQIEREPISAGQTHEEAKALEKPRY